MNTDEIIEELGKKMGRITLRAILSLNENDDPLVYGRYHGNLIRSINGKRGQAFLKRLLVALEEMPVKKLYRGVFKKDDGCMCALGALAEKEKIKTDDLLFDGCSCDVQLTANRFGVSKPLVAEIMFENDSYSCPLGFEKDAEDRWLYMRNWVKNSIKVDAK